MALLQLARDLRLITKVILPGILLPFDAGPFCLSSQTLAHTEVASDLLALSPTEVALTYPSQQFQDRIRRVPKIPPKPQVTIQPTCQLFSLSRTLHIWSKTMSRKSSKVNTNSERQLMLKKCSCHKTCSFDLPLPSNFNSSAIRSPW